MAARKPAPKKATTTTRKRAPRRSSSEQPTDADATGGHQSIDLDSIVDYRQPPTPEGGQPPPAVPVTLLERCVETLRTGGTVKDAAARMGVHRDTFYTWVSKGAALSGQLLAGDRNAASLTKEEAKHVRFAHATEQAIAERKAYLTGLAQRLAAGGYERRVVTERVSVDDDGNVKPLERTEKVEHAEPNGQMIRFLLERQYRDDFGAQVTVTGPEGGPVQVENVAPIDELLGKLDRMAEQQKGTDDLIRQAAKNIQASQAVEAPPNGSNH